MNDTTKPVPSVRAALQAIVDTTVFISSLTPEDQELIRNAKAALAAPFGLPVEQESKYTTCPQTGLIVNRATGKPIPPDEPIMIFRAQDAHAAKIIMRYHDLILETGSTFVESCFERAQAFIAFRERHPERMKKPD